jgi:hypothetical protein
MPKKGPENPTRSNPRERACDMCNEYTAHMGHRGLVYQILYDANGGYHRHIACCPDLGLRVQTEKVQ